MTAQEIAKQRLSNQQLTGTTFKKPVELLRWFCAIQAQEYAQSKWSFGLRIPALTDSDVEADLTSGKILRTHIMRPTWHFVAAEDIRWMLTLTKDRVHAASKYMYRQLELDEKIFTKSTRIIEKRLEGGTQTTREVIKEELRKSKIKAEGHRLSYILMHAELEGILCSGARQGNQFTYALLEERVPVYKSLYSEEALTELTYRYFASRGPATIHDFATWSGLTVTDCKRGVESVSRKLQQTMLDNVTYYFTDLHNSTSATLRLLPIYDEYIMGYKNRDAILHTYNQLNPKPGFEFDNTVVSNGQIIGTWKRVIKSKNMVLEHKIFQPFSQAEKTRFEKAVLRYQEFTGLQIEVK